jgi:hypothetical protein
MVRPGGLKPSSKCSQEQGELKCLKCTRVSIVFVTITFRLVACGRCRPSPPSAGEPKSAEQGMQNVEVSDITQQLLHSALDILHSIFNSDRFKYRTSMTSPPNFKRNTILTTTMECLSEICSDWPTEERPCLHPYRAGMKPAPTSFNTPKRRGGVHPLPNRDKPVPSGCIGTASTLTAQCR